MNEIRTIVDEIVKAEQLSEARIKSEKDRTLDDWRILFEDMRVAWNKELDAHLMIESDAQKLAWALGNNFRAMRALKVLERSFQDFLINTEQVTHDEAIKLVARVARQYLADLRIRIDVDDRLVAELLSRYNGDIPF